ncbi:RNA polymerase sigma factor [Eudoraea chungangensis]|uniref:RNA polymerase sigma factor n=1 Tax=Eudoraea chungangensis TaxID=1481905 RepID=UPI0023ED07D2|nr:RNA polymerase sigma factor [Eudoraea chungangensis]
MAVTQDDLLIINQLKEGDQRALLVLYDKYAAALYGVIIRICKREDIAQDVLQDSFLKIWQKIKTYDENKGRFYTWAYRIAKNTALNSIRNTAKLIQTEEISVYNSISSNPVEIDSYGLKNVLSKLEPQHKRAVELVYFEGLTHMEAHKEMKVPLGTFKSYVRQALQKLRENKNDLYLVLVLLEVLGYG